MPDSFELQIRPDPPSAGLPAVQAVLQDLVAAVLSGRNARTIKAYQSDFEDFARFMSQPRGADALDILTAFPHGTANATAIAYRGHLVERKLAASTINRRLSALRAACKIARSLGRIGWSLEVEAPKAEAYRDTRGPGREGYQRLLAAAKARGDSPKARRDVALVRTLHDLALRRAEAINADLADLDLAGGTLAIRGKGKAAKTILTLPAPTRAALADWIAVRGEEPGPLFTRLTRASTGRLSGEGVRLVVKELGAEAGLSRVVRPHGLRHQAITRALDLSNGNLRAVKKFSRHSKSDTLEIYDDNRQDLAGGIASIIADD